MATVLEGPFRPALTNSTRRVPESGLTAIARILAIEDDRAVRVLKRLFELEGYTVDLAADGTSGLELLRRTTPSAVLLDLVLPDISGEEICRRITCVAPGLPIIVVSARSEVVEKVLLLEMGAFDYVTKPFSPRELPGSVQAASDRRRPM